MFFLHGILGKGSNLRSIARKFVQAREDWGAVLVDLRLHGESQDLPGPHTVAHSAADLEAIENQMGHRASAIFGHSFGGRVALTRVKNMRPSDELDSVWIIDSPLGSGMKRETTQDVVRIFESLDRISMPISSRADFSAALTSQGVSRSTSEWLATNLERKDTGGFVLGIDPHALRELFEESLSHELWPVLEHLPEQVKAVHMVIGGASDVFSADDRARLQEIAQKEPRVLVHIIPNAGHWVHVDSPQLLLDLLLKYI